MNQISRRNKISLGDRQAQLQALLAERLTRESAATQQRVYEWLSDNQRAAKHKHDLKWSG